MVSRIRIATRQSPLALWQAEHAAYLLRSQHPGLITEIIGITTRGDKILDAPLAKIGGKGLFVKELEQSLLASEADIAVHSIKDVPVDFPNGLHLAVILEREDPRDALVSGYYSNLAALPKGARVGTSSLRRQCQLAAQRPDLQLEALRGNVNTRLAKLDSGIYDAVVLASAGLLRLGFAERIREFIAPENMLPAIGQGAIGIECRSNDSEINQLLTPLHHIETAARVQAERALNTCLQGGCQVPIGGYAEKRDEQLYLRGLVGTPDGSKILYAEGIGDFNNPADLGKTVAEALLTQGAAQILRALMLEN